MTTPGSTGDRPLTRADEVVTYVARNLEPVRGFHTLTDELMAQVTQAAQNAESEESESPFGFAAFTSLARGIPARWI